MQKTHCKIATINDASLLASISSTTFYDTYHQHNTKDNMNLFELQHFNLKTISDEITNPFNTFLMVYESENLCGYAKLNEATTPKLLEDFSVIEIARLYTIKTMIGKGIGKILMNESVAIAEQKQKNIIWLGVWKQNFRAISFYKKNGFTIFNEHIFYLGNDKQDDWLMKKILF